MKNKAELIENMADFPRTEFHGILWNEVMRTMSITIWPSIGKKGSFPAQTRELLVSAPCPVMCSLPQVQAKNAHTLNKTFEAYANYLNYKLLMQHDRCIFGWSFEHFACNYVLTLLHGSSNPTIMFDLMYRRMSTLKSKWG